MNAYEIVTTGTAREVYTVEADTESEAREIFARGDVIETPYVEVDSVEIESVRCV